ncbi:glycosyltransferase family 9 protein [Mycolicibacterium sp. P1-5]|uniref:glycosyltransferase family 9 protein n=1 Tax=Mycolicibacterium sp. P1-5 TaxID=2024617 RepID=UPI0011EE14BA|nr:glycosyltransferase family 9 protein [Mycolicibacterium sp. P1-5]KAA0104636.1 glycosyltransferase family 9 protein [Mycolicibacterium sp. P1-5]
MAVSHTDTILVLRALGLGDLLTSIPALRGLRRAFGHSRIVLATPEPLAPLALMSEAVDEVIPTAGLGALTYRGPRPALAVNLHGSGPESIRDLMNTDPVELLTHRHRDFPGLVGLPWRLGQHEVDRWCALLQWAGIDCAPNDLSLNGQHVNRGDIVVIHPGAADAARRWPADRFAAVADRMRRDGHDVVVTGSAAEQPLARSVVEMAGLPESSCLAGQLDILELVELIARCRLLVCGDTGVGHIATATGTPSVLVFGPTPPSQWGPRGGGPHVALWAGDVGDPHGDRPHSGLLLITVDRVVDATRELLAAAA